MSAETRYFALGCPRCDHRHCTCDLSPPPGASLVPSISHLGVVEARQPANMPFALRRQQPVQDRHLAGTVIAYTRGEVRVVGIVLAHDHSTITVLAFATAEPVVLGLEFATIEIVT